MSADNGIYIARFKDGSKVIHAQAIENLSYRWSDKIAGYNYATVYQYYKDLPLLSDNEANNKAFELEKEVLSDEYCPILEYGISSVDFTKITWDELIQLAKKDAEIELPFMRLKPDLWKHNIESFEEILAIP